jgi:hypothetical protein
VFLEASKSGDLWTFLRVRDEESWKDKVLERRDNYGFDVQTMGTIRCSSKDMTMRDKKRENVIMKFLEKCSQ